jgi:CheY-like chemotaxis protein
MASILLIDDNVWLRRALRGTLEGAGHEVEEAGNGAEGIQAFRRRPSDVLFCDLFMPDKDGLETIRELRGEFPAVKVIAMSGGGFAGTMDLLPVARLLGAVQVLPKPFDREAVLAAVEEALRAPRRK